MSKSAMLRTRRRDVNVKPNRRLDRKSSRGMIYENEELRLRTININAEIERGQSDIKKLRKENEQLRKEIWCLRDEYDKLDRLLKEKHDCTSSSDSETCTSCSESEDPETTQNLENVQKTTLNSLRNDFDHLSVVTEETSAENSDKNSQNSIVPSKDSNWEVLPPDMGYPTFGPPKNPRLISTTQNLHLNGSRTLLAPLGANVGPPEGLMYGGQSSTLPLPSGNNPQCPKHFFAPLKSSKSDEILLPPQPPCWEPFQSTIQPILTTFTCAPHVAPSLTVPQVNLPPLNQPPTVVYNNLIPIQKSAPDILVQTNLEETSTNSFVNGGTLDELLQDIDNISQDILKISSGQGEPQNGGQSALKADETKPKLSEDLGRPYKSEISVVLMPQPMPLLGFDKYQNIRSSLDSLDTLKYSKESIVEGEAPGHKNNPFFFGSLKSDLSTLEEGNKTTEASAETSGVLPDSPKTPQTPNKRTRKLSIYFKGKKDKPERSLSLDIPKTLPPSAPKTDPKDSDNQKSSDSKTSYDKKHRKSSSTSPERRHVHIQDGGKKHHKKKRKNLNRRNSLSAEKFHRDQRSFSICTDRSNILLGFDDLQTNSERDRSNSLSSCDTIKSRKTSQLPQLAVGGKIPWFGCWGNGCL